MLLYLSQSTAMSEEEGVLLTSEVAADGCGEDFMFDPGCAPFLPFENESIAVRGNGTCAHSLNKRGVIVWCCLLQGYRKWPAIMQQEKTLFLRLFGEKRLANQNAQRRPSDPTTQRRRSPVSPEANKIFLRCCAIFIRLRSFVLYSVLCNQSALV